MEISRFTVSPTPNALPANTKEEVCSKPLKIITTTERSRNQSLLNCELDDNTKFSASSKVLTILTTLPMTSSTSPSNSLDSGVSSPSYDLLFHSTTNSAKSSPPIITFNSPCSTFNYQRHHHRSTCYNCGKKHQIIMSCDSDTLKPYNSSIINCCQSTERSRSSSLTIDAMLNMHNLINNESKNQILNCNDFQNNKTTGELEKNICNDLLIETFNNKSNNTNSIIEKADPYLNNNKETDLNLNSNNSINRLKGILKKPSFDYYCRNELKSQQSNRVTASSRSRLSRSVSECTSNNFNQSDYDVFHAFNEMIIGSRENLKSNETLYEDNNEFIKSLIKDFSNENCNCCQLKKDSNNNSDLSLNVSGDNENFNELSNL